MLDEDDIKKIDEDTIKTLHEKLQEYKEELPETNENTKFKHELDNLYTLLQTKYNHCAKIQHTIQQDESTIQCIHEQAMTAKQSYDETKQMKETLQTEVNQCKHNAEQFRLSEMSNKQHIQEKNEQNEQLSKLISCGSGWTNEQRLERETLLKSIDDARLELQTSKELLNTKRSDVWEKQQLVDLEEQKVDEIKQSIDAIDNDIQQLQNQTNEQTKFISSLQQQKEQLMMDLEEKQIHLDEQERINAFEQNETQKELDQLKNMKQSMDTSLKTYDDLLENEKQLQNKLDQQNQTNQQLIRENLQMEELISKRKKEEEKDTQQINKWKNMSQYMTEKINIIETERIETEQQRDELKLQLKQIEGAELTQARKEYDAIKRQIDDSKRELEVLDRKVNISQNGSNHINEIIRLNQNKLKNLDNEFIGLQKIIKDHQQTIDTLTSNHKKTHDDLLLEHTKQNQMMHHLNEMGQQINDIEKEWLEVEQKAKDQLTMYESTQKDKNAQSKILTELHDEIDGMKKEMHFLDRQIHQLKQDISKIENSVVYKHFHHYYVNKKKVYFKDQIKNMKTLDDENKIISTKYENKIQELTKTLKDKDQECQNKHNDHSKILNERDSLGTQLVATNDRIEKLNNRIKFQLSTLHREGLQYQLRFEEIQALTEKCRISLNDRKEIFKKVSIIDVLNRKCISLDRDLLNEKTRNKALAEELGRPINVHRLRHLEHSDPKRFDMVRKIQNLQKRIISTSDDLIQINKCIHEKENLYLDLKYSLGRVAAFEDDQNQVEDCEDNLNDQKKQMHSLTLELDVYKNKVDKLKEEIKALDESSQELNSKWIKQKTAEICENESLKK